MRRIGLEISAKLNMATGISGASTIEDQVIRHEHRSCMLLDPGPRIITDLYLPYSLTVGFMGQIQATSLGQTSSI